MVDRRAATAIVAIATASCSADARNTFHQPPPAAIFSAEVHRVVVEVDYASGAEPYTGRAGTLPDLWGITRANLSALFADSPKALTLPSALGEMQKIDVPDGPYGSTDILSIAEKNRDVLSSGDAVSFYVVFLNGLYEVNGVTDDTVLGAALAGTGVIAVFKPVVQAAEAPFEPNAALFTEQATIVHEIGHSVGLVNVGLPMAQAHEDASHPSHCDNSRCVMYWANEGATGLGQFLFGTVEKGDEVLFDSFCLADARAAARPSDGGSDADGARRVDASDAVTDVFVARDR